MESREVIEKLRAHEHELRASGVASLSLFGSVARNEEITRDVDVAVRLDEKFCHNGFDYFGRLDDLERMLAEFLGAEVDVIEEPVRKERVQTEIDRDRIVAF